MKKNQGASDGPITIMTLLEKVGIKGILIGLFVMFVILEIITLAKGKKTTKEVATPTDAVATLTDVTTEAPAVLDFGLADDTLVATSGDAGSIRFNSCRIYGISSTASAEGFQMEGCTLWYKYSGTVRLCTYLSFHGNYWSYRL